MKNVVKLTLLMMIAFAPLPVAAQSQVQTFSESRSFSGSFVQSGYNVRSDIFGNVEFGNYGSTVNGGCVPNSECAISTGGTSNSNPGLYAANSTSSLLDSNYNIQRGTSGSAYASLYSGVLGAFASGQSRNCPGYECGVNSSAIAQIGENLHFIVSGASPTTRTSIGFTLDIDGNQTANTDSFAQALMRVLPNGQNPAQFLAQINSANILSTGADGWTSFTLSPANPGHLIFTGFYDLVGAATDIGLSYSLLARSGTGVSDYGSTGRFGLVLPNNVSFTSNSGVFLTANTVSAVPEPTTWMMMIVGFGIIGLAMRRRTKVTAQLGRRLGCRLISAQPQAA